MTGIGQDPRVRAYLDAVCSKVRAKDRHAEIREELLGHLEELAEELRAEGMEEQEAAREALRRMGDAERVGAGLHLAHRPKPDLWLAAMAGLMLLAGLAYVYGLQQLYELPSVVESSLGLGALGLLPLAACYYVPLPLLRRWCWLFFGTGALLLAATIVHGVRVNGQMQLSIGAGILDSAPIAMLLLFAGAAGIVARPRPAAADRKSLWLQAIGEAALLGLIPAVLFLSSSQLARLPLYGAGLIVLVALNRRWRLALSGVAMLPVFALFLIRRDSFYAWERIANWSSAEDRSRFLYGRALDAMQSAGWFGQGLPNGPDPKAPIGSEFLFPFLVYSLGWAFGLLLGALLLLFIGRCFVQALRVQDPQARALAAALAAVFGVQTMWSLLLSFGLLPVVGFSLPFLSWGSPLLGEMAMLGMLLGLIRQRDRRPEAFSSAAG
ncbi:FtsW/RodA/SpoVE family cell cycle protein [Paenibacillus pasadenensis]|uniref:Cell division protein FtsW n=1 Tax=Paenibacillus pasadenensis TaxID=217090 RepID=A0A2N5NAS7_9BACL|nr:FtsW/RodA/SpoVE family cell cycle protein [Paenibacillus pasadenensis]PLT47428.1 Cell division protein FtsW [Paenibacillus pasadenensis]